MKRAVRICLLLAMVAVLAVSAAALCACDFESTPTECTVTLNYADATGGIGQRTIKVTKGQPIGALPTPTMKGGEFIGWFYRGSLVTADTIWQGKESTAEFEARFERADFMCHVTYIADGKVIEERDFPAAEAEHMIISWAPEIPEKQGYTADWEKVTDITENITVNAVYTPVKFTVTFIADNIEVGSDTYSKDKTTVTEPAVPAKEGFDGAWEKYTLDGGDKIVQAVYTGKKYTVTLNYDGATGNNTKETITVTYDERVGNDVLPEPQKYGYAFLGWYLRDKEIGANTTWDILGNDTTLVAKWVKRSMLNYQLLSENNAYAVTGLASWVTDKNLDIEIPSTYNNKPVRAIADNAFKNNAKIAKVTIADSITEIGDSAFYGTKLTSVVIPDSVTVLGNEVFFNCAELATVKLGNGLTEIGDSVFYGCAKLTNLELPTYLTKIGANAFENCLGLTTLSIQTQATIGENAFNNCYRLVEIHNTSALRFTAGGEDHGKIAYYAKNIYSSNSGSKLTTDKDGYVIYDGTTLVDYRGTATEITIPRNITIINGYALYGRGLTKVTVPATVTEIGLGAFNGCGELTEITLPFVGDRAKTAEDDNQYPFGYIFGRTPYTGGENTAQHYISVASTKSDEIVNYYIPTSLKTVTITGGEILYGAFSKCINLKTINIPNNITKIGEIAFWYCESLTTLPSLENVTTIDASAFWSCKSLTSIDIPNGVESIGRFAFGLCDKVTSVIVRDSMTNIDEFTFGANNIAFISASDSVFLNIKNKSKLEVAKITSGTEIAADMFKDCAELRGVFLSDSITKIGASAFEGCAKLTEITIHNKVTEIGMSAFKGCASLTTLTIPNSVTKLEASTFEGCTNLETLIIPSSITSVGSAVFAGCDKLKFNEQDNALYLGNNANPYVVLVKAKAQDIATCEINANTKVIYELAFDDCNNLTTITVPDNVLEIGAAAFKGCSKLESITLPFAGKERKTPVDTYQYPFGYIFGTTEYAGGVATSQDYPKTATYLVSETFYIPESLTAVTITDSDIMAGAFEHCENLTSVTLGDKVTQICARAFVGCSKLSEITFTDSMTTIDTLFSSCTNLQKVNYLGDIASWCNTDFTVDNPLISAHNLYLNDTLITELVIPNGVTEIKPNAFSGGNFTKVTIADTVTKIGEGAFRKCIEFDSLTLSAVAVGRRAFESCLGLTTLVVEAGVSLDEYAFQASRRMSTITLADDVVLATDTFSGCLINDATIPTHAISYMRGTLETLTLTSGTLTVDTFFGRERTIKTVTVLDGVTSIAMGAFRDFNVLESITLPFIGNKMNPTETDSKYPLGYIFGRSSYTGGVATKQDFFYREYGKNMTDTYYIPETLRSVTVTGGILYDGAFDNCTGLTSITICGSVASIASGSIENCANLETLIVESNVPNVKTTIAKGAINSCGSLVDVTIGNNVTNIGEGILSGCSKLESITLPFVGDKVKTSTYSDQFPLGYIFGTTAYEGGVATKQEYYGNYSNRTTITTYYIPSSLKNVTITGGNILYGAFNNCSNLTSITIPDNTTAIGANAFNGCSGLKKFVIPATVESIGANAFSNCVNLIEIYNKSSLQIVSESTDNGNVGRYALDIYTTEGGSKLTTDENGLVIYDNKVIVDYCGTATELTIPSGITSIWARAFNECNLTSVVLPEGLERIGERAFCNCTDLTSIVIPDSVKKIDAMAFYGCANIKTVVLGSSLETIYSSAFEKLSAIEAVYYKGSRDDWSKVDFNRSTGNLNFYACIHYYSVDTPASDGYKYWHYDTDGVTPVAWPKEA